MSFLGKLFGKKKRPNENPPTTALEAPEPNPAERETEEISSGKDTQPQYSLTEEDYNAIVAKLREEIKTELLANMKIKVTTSASAKQEYTLQALPPRQAAQTSLHSQQYQTKKPIPSKPLSHTELVALADTRNLYAYSGEVELKAEEILLLKYIDGSSVDLSLPEYFTWKYHIDYKKAFERFGTGGYLEYATIEYSLSQQKKATLEEILAYQGLSTKGKKGELVCRLLELSNWNHLSKFQKQFLCVTDKGHQLFADNEYIWFFTANERVLDIPLKEAEKAIKQHPELSSEMVAMKILEDCQQKSILNKDIMCLRLSIFRKGYVYEMLEDYVQAIISYIGAGYYEYLLLLSRDCIECYHATDIISRLSFVLSKNEEYPRLFDEFITAALTVYIKLWQDSHMPRIDHDIQEFYNTFTKLLGEPNTI